VRDDESEMRARWRVQWRARTAGRASSGEARRAVAMAGTLGCRRCCGVRGRVKWGNEEEATLPGRRRRARGAESGRGCRAAGVAGAWWPRGKRALALVGTRRALANGEREQGSGAEAGRAVFGRGPGSEAAAREREKPFSIYIFKKFLNASFQILF
jgi:hypothetical protein